MSVSDRVAEDSAVKMIDLLLDVVEAHQNPADETKLSPALAARAMELMTATHYGMKAANLMDKRLAGIFGNGVAEFNTDPAARDAANSWPPRDEAGR